MRAISYSAFGPAAQVLHLSDLPMQEPAAGEVVVALEMSGVNPSDVKARAGARPGVTRPPFPNIIPHSDGAGRIEAVGDGVDPQRIGQRVWIWNGQWQRAFGTCATHITLPAAQAVAMPDAVSMETGAQLGIPGLTAAHAVWAGGEVSGKTVLVQGGAGTVGYLAVQLAKWGGARVIGTARGAGMAHAEAAGADAVLDYSSDTLTDQILEAASGPVDHIVEVEFGLNAATSATVIAENGSICAYGSAKAMNPEIPFYQMMFKAVTLHMALIYILPPEPRAAAIERLHRAISEGGLTCPVAGVFDLSETAKAHEAVEAGGRFGGILVDTASK